VPIGWGDLPLELFLINLDLKKEGITDSPPFTNIIIMKFYNKRITSSSKRQPAHPKPISNKNHPLLTGGKKANEMSPSQVALRSALMSLCKIC
jgi:hypothetical protein